MARQLLSAIAQKRARIGIIGLGYVGLPLARAFCEAGFPVWGFDTDTKKLDQLKAGQTYLQHLGADMAKTMLAKGFVPTPDMADLAQMDAIIICVPTPLRARRQPDLRAVLATGKTIARYLQKGQLVVLESSTYPGTTSEDLAAVLAKSGLVPHTDFHLAYSPEREDPGNPDFSTRTIPKIVGADTVAARKASLALYEQIVTRVVAVSSTRVAEAAKLTENIFRSVNIAMVNELKMAFDKMGLDIWEVIDAASTKPFGYMPFYPGPGLGGHCIPIDPFYMAYKARQYGAPTRFIALAGAINTAQPAYVVARLRAALAKNKRKISGSRFLLIGLAYKPDIDDIRSSPSLEIMAQLKKSGARVDYHDPLVRVLPATRNYPHLAGYRSVPLRASAIGGYAAVIICTAHANVAYNMLAQHARLVVDTRNIMAGRKGKAAIIKA